MIRKAITHGVLAVMVTVGAASAEMGYFLDLEGGASIAKLREGEANFFTATDDVNTEGLNFFTAGLGLTMEFNRYLALQPRVLYLRKGAKYKGNLFAIDGEVDVRMDYIEIPVVLKAMLPVDIFYPYVFVGPSVGLNVGAEREGSIEEWQIAEPDISDQVNTADFSLAFGVATSVAAPFGKIYAEGGYWLGLIEVFENDERRTGTWRIVAGLSVPLGATESGYTAP